MNFKPVWYLNSNLGINLEFKKHSQFNFDSNTTLGCLFRLIWTWSWPSECLCVVFQRMGQWMLQCLSPWAHRSHSVLVRSDRWCSAVWRGAKHFASALKRNCRMISWSEQDVLDDCYIHKAVEQEKVHSP